MTEPGAPVPAAVEAMRARRDKVRAELGGTAKVERVHAAGRRTIREHIDAFLDAGSFEEVGTFARSANPADATRRPATARSAATATSGHGR